MSGGPPSDDTGWRPAPQNPIRPTKKGGQEGGGGDQPPDPCAITETTNLNSVDQAVLATLHQGSVLSVVYQAGPPRRLVAEAAPGIVAGSITSPSMAQIIRCISNGYSYNAVVVSIRGAQCQVRIEPR